MNLDQVYLDKLCVRLQFLDAEIRRWNVQAKTASADAQPQLVQQLQSLCEKRDLVQEFLAQLRGATSAAWHIIKTGMESAWCDFTQAVEQATLTFDS